MGPFQGNIGGRFFVLFSISIALAPIQRYDLPMSYLCGDIKQPERPWQAGNAPHENIFLSREIDSNFYIAREIAKNNLHFSSL
jgi:hypothetical protein